MEEFLATMRGAITGIHNIVCLTRLPRETVPTAGMVGIVWTMYSSCRLLISANLITECFDSKTRRICGPTCQHSKNTLTITWSYDSTNHLFQSNTVHAGNIADVGLERNASTQQYTEFVTHLEDRGIGVSREIVYEE